MDLSEIRISKVDRNLIVDFSSSSLRKEYKKLLRIKRLLRGNLSETTLTLPYTDEAFENTIKYLKETFTIDDDINVSNELELESAKINKSREEFITFSTFARDIRDNKYVADDYADFQDSLYDLKRPLKNFQLLAAYHIAFSKNASNFSVPGAGKTTTVLAAYNYLRKKKYISKIIVVSPIAAFQAWQDEYIQCFGRHPNLIELYGKTKASKDEIEKTIYSQETPVEILLINYSSLRSYGDILTAFMKIHDCMLVLDEAHKIKKIDGGDWSSNALKLAPFAKSRVVLTGTPAPNDYSDLCNLYEFVWPGKNIIGYSPQQLKMYSFEPDKYFDQIETLINRIEPFYIRITKKDLNLTPPTFNYPFEVEMDEEQSRIYSGLEEAYDMPNLLKDYSNNRPLLTAKLIRLRQAASHPGLLTKSLSDYYDNLGDDYSVKYELNDELMVGVDIKKLILDYTKTPQKYFALLELIKAIQSKDGRAIIWCEFVYTIHQLSTFLNSKDINHRLLYGGIENEERVKVIHEFQRPDASFDIIIANPHAVGESISIHQHCHNAVYFEMGFNAASYMQSKDRIHRVGLAKGTKTQYHYLVSKNTIETSIVERVVEKERKMLGIVEKNEIPLIANNSDFLEDSQDDLKKLIREYYERHNLV